MYQNESYSYSYLKITSLILILTQTEFQWNAHCCSCSRLGGKIKNVCRTKKLQEYSQLAMNRWQVCSSRGNRARCMEQAAVRETLQTLDITLLVCSY